MRLWNTDAPGSNKVIIWQKSLSPTFWPRPTPGACDVSEVWGTHRWTYSPSLVTVPPPKLEILLFVSRTELRTIPAGLSGRGHKNSFRKYDSSQELIHNIKITAITFNLTFPMQFSEGDLGQGSSDFHPFRHYWGGDQFVCGHFLLEFVIRGLVKQDQVVKFVPDLSLGPLLQGQI